MKIKSGYVTMTEPDGRGKVTAVQDHFGGAYRRCQGRHEPGEVLKFRLCDCGRRAMAEDGEAMLVFKILRPVHHNTVRAVLRKIGKGGLSLAAGHWYEVHGD